jgi:2-hydroxy-3-oxopropionate reductase
MSSIAPLVSRELSLRLAEKGMDMLDAPVSGGEPKAITARCRSWLEEEGSF